MVFAHYFTPYTISEDNKDPTADYYATTYLKPTGASAAYGGMLRDRPLPRSPLSGNWQLTDMETEVKQAVSEGINGWTMDILTTSGYNWDRVNLMMDAAADVDPDFKVMIVPDMSGSVGNLDDADLAKMISELAAKPAAYKLSDGRLVVSPFKAEAWSVARWTDVISILESSYGISMAFVPMFLNYHNYAAAYAGISYGISDWGTRTPRASASLADNATAVHALGKIWMQTLSVQDARPDQGNFFEADNLANLRDSWQGAISGGADWIQLATWNDYSESTSFAPSAAHGWTFLDVNAYYAAEFLTGHTPTISKDALYVTHRIQFANAEPTYPQTSLMTLRSDSSPVSDAVEVQSFLLSPATITATVGSNTYTWPAAAGVNEHSVPLAYGTVSVTAQRDDKTAASVTSPYVVTPAPYTQDLQYYGVSSLRQ